MEIGISFFCAYYEYNGVPTIAYNSMNRAFQRTSYVLSLFIQGYLEKRSSSFTILRRLIFTANILFIQGRVKRHYIASH